jgi:hypothetical protein
MAVIGALFFGSPIPRWITGSPRSFRMRASSFNLRVGDSTIDRASWLIVIEGMISYLFNLHKAGNQGEQHTAGHHAPKLASGITPIACMR